LADKSFEEFPNDSINKNYGRQKNVTYDELQDLETFPNSCKKIVVDRR
jgi:hypothetical protein